MLLYIPLYYYICSHVLISPSFYSYLLYLIISPYISLHLFHISHIACISLYLSISPYVSSYLTISDHISYVAAFILLFHYISTCLSTYHYNEIPYGWAQRHFGNIWLCPNRTKYHMAEPWKNNVLYHYIFDISPYLAIFSFRLLIDPSFYSHLVYLMVSPYISPCLFHISYISHISLYLLISFYIFSYLTISHYILYIPVYRIFLYLTISSSVSLYLHISLHTLLQLDTIWLGPKTIRNHMYFPKDNWVPYGCALKELRTICYISIYPLHFLTSWNISPYITIFVYICLYVFISASFYSNHLYLIMSPYISLCLFCISYIS